MKKMICILLVALSLEPVSVFSAESKRLMDESFVVETTDSDATDSLNRIAGKIDAGFALEDSTYHSVHHGRSGPFSTHEDAYDVLSTH